MIVQRRDLLKLFGYFFKLHEFHPVSVFVRSMKLMTKALALHGINHTLIFFDFCFKDSIFASSTARVKKNAPAGAWYPFLARISHEEYQKELEKRIISINCVENQAQFNTTHCFEMQIKSRLMFFTKGRPERPRNCVIQPSK